MREDARLRSGPRCATDIALACGALAAATVLGRVLGANATTVGLGFLVVVLGLSVWRGLLAGTAGSLAGTALFNYFFLPPIGTLTIADPANWVALASFLIASFVTSRLVVTARRRAQEAEERGLEVERLYDLSLALFAATNRVGALGEAAGRALAALEARGGGLLVLPAEADRARTWIPLGTEGASETDPLVDAVLRSREAAEVPGVGASRDVYTPLLLGGRLGGVLVVKGTRAGRTAVESVARLVALAIEREAFLAARSHLEALRESDALKTSLLRAVSHDLRTPLTAIRLDAESAKRLLPAGAEAADPLRALTREVEHLSRRIDNLLSMARLQAGMFVPRPEPSLAADLFRAAREALPLVLEEHPLKTTVARDCPELLVDPSLAVEILVNLLENAARVTPPGGALELAAAAHPLDEALVRLEVLDRGPGPPERSGEHPVVDGAIGDAPRTGLGLMISRSLAKACSGTVSLGARAGGGTVARVDFPAFREAA